MMVFCGKLHVIGQCTAYAVPAGAMIRVAPEHDHRVDVVAFRGEERRLFVYTAFDEPALTYDFPIVGKRWLFAQHYTPSTRNAFVQGIPSNHVADASHLLRRVWWRHHDTPPLHVCLQSRRRRQGITVFICETYFAVWMCCRQCARDTHAKVREFIRGN